MNEDDPQKQKVADIGETSKETEIQGTPLSEPDECPDETCIEEEESLKEITEDESDKETDLLQATGVSRNQSIEYSKKRDSHQGAIQKKKVRIREFPITRCYVTKNVQVPAVEYQAGQTRRKG
ncbi:hypothetical protein A4A49_41716 [Nicotiana attenuata]|uniref:Uncharacterized protein n=1 Tax=Nicotiana attenuata TaxID=49451 RepID=A0A1J6K9K7_NICAT|nr:hypothetical protein A4A49_41716 [Nicotiana attenuata]